MQVSSRGIRWSIAEIDLALLIDSGRAVGVAPSVLPAAPIRHLLNRYYSLPSTQAWAR